MAKKRTKKAQAQKPLKKLAQPLLRDPKRSQDAKSEGAQGERQARFQNAKPRQLLGASGNGQESYQKKNKMKAGEPCKICRHPRLAQIQKNSRKHPA